LSWADAKPIAVAICFGVMNGDNAAEFIPWHANALSGRDSQPWQDRERAARAMNIAATVLGF
jgi:hypothetical protein